MTTKPSWGDRVISVVVWAVIAAIPVGLLKVVWDQKYLTVQMLEEAGNSPLVLGWGLVFLGLVLFMWKNERVNSALARQAEQARQSAAEAARLEKEHAALRQHVALKDEVHRQKLQQLYDDVEQQVQRRLLLAQQATGQDAAQRNRLLDLRARRLDELKANAPLLGELKSVAECLRNLQAQVVTGAGVRLLPPGEVPAAVRELTAPAARLILVTHAVRGEALAAFDAGLAPFWERGGKLVLWFSVTLHALQDEVELAPFLAWWKKRGTQVECWGYREPQPRLVVADGRAALLLPGDLLGSDPLSWGDLSTLILAPGLTAELTAGLEERMLDPAREPGRLRLDTGAWESYTDRLDHGIVHVTGFDRELYVTLENHRLVNNEFKARPRGEQVQFLLRENQYGRYDYLGHTVLAAAPPAAAAAPPPAAALPF